MALNTTDTAVAAGVVESLERDGYAIVEGVLELAEVARTRAEVERLLASTPFGRDDFEGRATQRIYAMFAKTRAFDALATHPLALAVLDRVLTHYQLSSPAVIAIGPGERAQPLHYDDAIYPVARPHAELVMSVMWPLDHFTAANGATRIVAGSHQWIDEYPDADTPTVCAEMPSGSALFYPGTVWHGGGANTTGEQRVGVVLHYGASWLRAGENHVLAVPPAVARTLSQRMQELLGYNLHPPFLGNVDGRHPRKLLESPAH